MFKKTTLYDAVESTLEELKLKGIKMCICTNKKQYLAEKILLDLGVNNFFSIILGSTDKIKLKPDSSMLRFLINKLNLNVDEIMMVGDSENDIIPSNELGITSVFVEYGYGDFSNSTPTYKIKKIQTIIRFFLNFYFFSKKIVNFAQNCKNGYACDYYSQKAY